MLGSVGLALDDEGSPLHTFAFLRDKCYTGGGRRGSRPASLAGSVRRLPCERCRDWTWHHVPDAVAALARIVAGSRVGFGRKQETFTLLTSFRLAHEAATKVVRTHFRNRAAAGECTAEGVEALVTGLEAEAAAEMQRAETILASIDPRVQKTMRTLFVANTILAIQRDAVLNLAKKGLISGKELEILLEEVLEDAEDVCRPRRKRARRREARIRSSQVAKLEEARGGRGHAPEHHHHASRWVDAAHEIREDEIETRFGEDGSARPHQWSIRQASARYRVVPTAVRAIARQPRRRDPIWLPPRRATSAAAIRRAARASATRSAFSGWRARTVRTLSTGRTSRRSPRKSRCREIEASSGTSLAVVYNKLRVVNSSTHTHLSPRRPQRTN